MLKNMRPLLFETVDFVSDLLLRRRCRREAPDRPEAGSVRTSLPSAAGPSAIQTAPLGLPCAVWQTRKPSRARGLHTAPGSGVTLQLERMPLRSFSA